MINVKINSINSRAEEISKKFNLFRETSAILLSRGIENDSDIERFLHPSKNNFINPFLLENMQVAVDRITQARDEGETVVVYGDYDVDGLSATAIAYRALKEFGITPITFVPERASGYGLSIENIDKILDEYLPSLIITVDCGISSYDEVEYLKDMAVDVIVTDHHELPDKLPDCPIINCKMPGYGFNGLCGAGVAYKLAYALIGEKANEYLDFVTIATIADSMPLILENRDLVYIGLQQIKNGGAHEAISALISSAGGKDITATSLAFTVAPRINAAGRMGDVASALKLFTTENSAEIKELVEKLNKYNIARQSECELLLNSARQQLIEKAYNKKIIVLKDDNWNGGLVGIIASKLVEEFSRPVILFAKNKENDLLHGSARSIDDVNIFEAISYAKEYLDGFGGHAQAAGVTVSQDNFELFKQKIEEYFDVTFKTKDFEKSKVVDLIIKDKFSIEFAREINKLEPFGIGNKKPTFLLETNSILIDPTKIGSPHLNIHTDIIDLIYFNGGDKLDSLRLPLYKSFIFEPNISTFNGVESLKGYVKDVELNIGLIDDVKLLSFKESLLTATYGEYNSLVDEDKLQELIDESKLDRYGWLFVCYNEMSIKDDYLKGLNRFLFTPQQKDMLNSIVFAFNDINLKNYKNIVYLDCPLGSVIRFNDKKVYVSNKLAYNYSGLDTKKEVFADIYRGVLNLGKVKCSNSCQIAKLLNLPYKKTQIIFALEVFIELKILSFDKGYLYYDKTVKSNLENSKIYSQVVRLKK